MGESTSQRAERAFSIGLWGNGLLAVAKLGVGLTCGSVALIADGWHSLSDILLNGGAWIAHRMARAPADDDHHFGHGNVEALSGVLVGGMLLVGGIGVAWNGSQAQIELEEGTAGLAALGMALVSIAANLLLTRISVKAAREARSPGLFALARDNLSDALAGVLVVLGILGSRRGLDWAEPLVAIAIGALIVAMGYRSLKEGFDVLMDRVPDAGLRERLGNTATAVVGVRGVQSVRVHPLGGTFHVEMAISVDGALTVEEGHRIAHDVEEALLRRHPELVGVHVHVNPWEPEETAPRPEPEPPTG